MIEGANAYARVGLVKWGVWGLVADVWRMGWVHRTADLSGYTAGPHKRGWRARGGVRDGQVWGFVMGMVVGTSVAVAVSSWRAEGREREMVRRLMVVMGAEDAVAREAATRVSARRGE